MANINPIKRPEPKLHKQESNLGNIQTFYYQANISTKVQHNKFIKPSTSHNKKYHTRIELTLKENTWFWSDTRDSIDCDSITILFNPPLSYYKVVQEVSELVQAITLMAHANLQPSQVGEAQMASQVIYQSPHSCLPTSQSYQKLHTSFPHYQLH